MDTSKNELKPCPFCRKEAKTEIVNNIEGGQKPVYQVICQECGARGPETYSISAAVGFWNLMPKVQTSL